MNIIIQLIAGMLGSVGFAMMFGLKAKYILSAAIGGFLSWGLYLLGMHIFDNIFLACLMASAFCAFYSEITARIQKRRQPFSLLHRYFLLYQAERFTTPVATQLCEIGTI